MIEIYADSAFPGRRGASLVIVVPVPHKIRQWHALFWRWLFAERRRFVVRPLARISEELYKTHRIDQAAPWYAWQHPPINARHYNEFEMRVGTEAIS